MPQAIAFAAASAASSALASAGATVATQAVVASAVATTVSFAAPVILSVGASYAIARLNQPSIPRPSTGQMEVQQPIPPRWKHYGRVKVAGPLGFLETVSEDQHKVIIIGEGPIGEFETILIRDKVATLDSGGDVTNDYVAGSPATSRIRVKKFLGTADQLASAELQSELSAYFTSAHRGRGIAYLHVRYMKVEPDKFLDVYKGSVPEVSAIIKASLVYDPRKDTTNGGSGSHRPDDPDTWEWSDNARLCAFDFARYEYGYGKPLEIFDLDSWVAGFNLCDQLVPLKAGGNERRYRVATSINLRDTPRSAALQTLLDASDARLFQTNEGKWGIRGGEWNTPTVEIDCDSGHVLDAEFTGGIAAPQRYNELAVTCMSPVHGFSEIEAEPWTDADLVTANGGLVRTEQFNRPQVPSFGQARRLAKIRIARDNPNWIGAARTNLSGMNAATEEAVNVTWSEMDVETEDDFDGPFFVEPGMSLSDDGTVSVPLRSAKPSAYTWNAATEEGTAPPVPPTELQGGGYEIIEA